VRDEQYQNYAAINAGLSKPRHALARALVKQPFSRAEQVKNSGVHLTDIYLLNTNITLGLMVGLFRAVLT